MDDKEKSQAEEAVEQENTETSEEMAETEAQETEATEEDNGPDLEAQLAEMNDKYLRLNAEFENFRKRTSKEKMDIIKTAGKEVILSLLEVLDDCEKTEELIKNEDDNAKAVEEGMLLIVNKLRKTLAQRGLKAIESKGEVFDVELHEALTEIAPPSEDLAGKVVDEINKGYYLNDKIIRHAKVVVGKKS